MIYRIEIFDWREHCRKQLSCSFEFYLYKFVGGLFIFAVWVCVVRQVNEMFVVDNLVYFTGNEMCCSLVSVRSVFGT